MNRLPRLTRQALLVLIAVVLSPHKFIEKNPTGNCI